MKEIRKGYLKGYVIMRQGEEGYYVGFDLPDTLEKILAHNHTVHGPMDLEKAEDAFSRYFEGNCDEDILSQK